MDGVDLLGQRISLYRTEDILDLRMNFDEHCPVSSESAEAINAHKTRQTKYVSRTGSSETNITPTTGSKTLARDTV